MRAPLLVLALSLGQLLSTREEPKTREGNAHYRAGELDEALKSYTRAQVDYPDAMELHYDIGNVQYRREDAEAAREEYRTAADAAPEIAARARFNLGNVEYGAEKWKEAVDAYSGALRIDPGDLEARQNLELALQKLKQEQEKQQQEKQGGGEGSEDKQDDKGEDQKHEQKDEQQSESDSSPEPQQGASGEQSADAAQAELTQEQAEQILQALAQMEQAQQLEQQEKGRAKARGKGKIW